MKQLLLILAILISPVVFSADHNSQKVCSNCQVAEQKEQFKICSGCKKTRYCSRECQVNHWKNGGHKADCKATKEKKIKKALFVMLINPHVSSKKELEEKHGIPKGTPLEYNMVLPPECHSKLSSLIIEEHGPFRAGQKVLIMDKYSSLRGQKRTLLFYLHVQGEIGKWAMQKEENNQITWALVDEDKLKAV